MEHFHVSHHCPRVIWSSLPAMTCTENRYHFIPYHITSHIKHLTPRIPPPHHTKLRPITTLHHIMQATYRIIRVVMVTFDFTFDEDFEVCSNTGDRHVDGGKEDTQYRESEVAADHTQRSLFPCSESKSPRKEILKYIIWKWHSIKLNSKNNQLCWAIPFLFTYKHSALIITSYLFEIIRNNKFTCLGLIFPITGKQSYYISFSIYV